jgi:hypothetical protein
MVLSLAPLVQLNPIRFDALALQQATHSAAVGSSVRAADQPSS